jgi:Tol biopolymer transport system component
VDSAFIRVRAGQPLPQSTRPPDATAGRLVFDVSPDGRFLAVARRGAGLRDSIAMRTIDGNRAGSVAEGVSPTFIDNDLLAFRATDGTLQVGRLNRERSQFVAPPTSLLPNVSLSGDGNAVYAIAYDGTLVYTQGGAASQSRPVWVGGGREQPIPNAESRVYGGAALSPNGRRAAITYGGLTGGGDIWISDLAQGSLSPLTSDGRSTRPSWTRDGKNVTYLHSLIGLGFAIDSGNRSRVFQRGADGAAPADTLPGPWPNDGVDELEWSPDGRYAAIRTRHGSGPGRAANRDIVIRRVGSDSTIPFATEAAQERGPRFSPDGKWLLYVSDRSGRDEVYAESFPGGGNRVQLSADGAREGIWSRDGSQVFYRAPDGWMISAHLSRGSALAVAKRDRLFDASPYLSNQFLAMYDVAPDGRFLMFKLDARPERTDVVLIRNWVQQVRARLAQAKP